MTTAFKIPVDVYSEEVLVFVGKNNFKKMVKYCKSQIPEFDTNYVSEMEGFSVGTAFYVADSSNARVAVHEIFHVVERFRESYHIEEEALAFLFEHIFSEYMLRVDK